MISLLSSALVSNLQCNSVKTMFNDALCCGTLNTTVPETVLKPWLSSFLPDGACTESEKIGFLLPMGGGISWYSNNMRVAMEGAIAEVSGYKNFQDGKCLEVVEENSGCSGSMGANAMTSVLEAGVSGIIGPLCTDALLGALPAYDTYSNQAKKPTDVPIVAASVTGNIFTKTTNPHLHRTSVPNSRVAKQIANDMIDQNIQNAVALVHTQSAAYSDLLNAFEETFTALGGTLLGVVDNKYGQNVSYYIDSAEQLKNSICLNCQNSTALLVISSVSSVDIVIKRVRSSVNSIWLAQGVTVPGINIQFEDLSIIEGARGYTSSFSTGKPRFDERFKDTNPFFSLGFPYAENSYDATALLLLGMNMQYYNSSTSVDANMISILTDSLDSVDVLPSQLQMACDLISKGKRVRFRGSAISTYTLTDAGGFENDEKYTPRRIKNGEIVNANEYDTIKVPAPSPHPQPQVCAESVIEVSVDQYTLNYKFNGESRWLYAPGQYKLMNVHKDHPIYAYQEDNLCTVSMSGGIIENSPHYQYGNITVTIDASCAGHNISFRCGPHGSMGIYERFVYSETCSK